MASFSVPAPSDAAEDAARLLQRLGYVVLALGAPCAEALSSRAIFLFFPIGAALLLVATTLNPVKGVGGRLYQALRSPGRDCRSSGLRFPSKRSNICSN
jgi:hypothetical protein